MSKKYSNVEVKQLNSEIIWTIFEDFIDFEIINGLNRSILKFGTKIKELFNISNAEISLEKVKEENNKYVNVFDEQRNKSNVKARFNVVNKKKEQDIINAKPSKYNFVLIKGKKELVDEDEVLDQLYSEIDLYYLAHDALELDIEYIELDIVFDYIYELFLKKGLEKKFYPVVSEFIRFIFDKSIEDNVNITISYVLEHLYYLKGHIKDYMDLKSINGRELLKLQKEIIEEIRTYNVSYVDFKKELKKRRVLKLK